MQQPEIITTEIEAATDRRSFLGKAAIAAAVASVAGVATSRPADAANGSNFIIGNVIGGTLNSATSTTRLQGGTSLEVLTGTSQDASIVGRQPTANRIGVLGEASGTSGQGVAGKNIGDTGIGVYGRNEGSQGVGVYGEHAGAGTIGGVGVVGVSNNGAGVEGRGGVDLLANGSGLVRMKSAGTLGPTTGGSVGTLARDNAGDMWACVAGNSWRKLAGPSTAGAYHAVSPGRVYDSREALPSPGALTNATNRTISVADKRNTAGGAVVTPNFVPAGAKAVTANITIQTVTGPGVLAVNPGGVVTTDASTINWNSAGQVIANGVTLTLNANRELTIVCFGGGSTHVIVDITGYYL